MFVDSVTPGKAHAVVVPPANEHVEGKLALAHVDNFDTGKSEYLYEVRSDDGRVTELGSRGVTGNWEG